MFERATAVVVRVEDLPCATRDPRRPRASLRPVIELQTTNIYRLNHNKCIFVSYFLDVHFFPLCE